MDTEIILPRVGFSRFIKFTIVSQNASAVIFQWQPFELRFKGPMSSIYIKKNGSIGMK